MAGSIKCDERSFKGGVCGGFAPPAKIEKKKTFFLFFEKSVLKSRFLRTVTTNVLYALRSHCQMEPEEATDERRD